MNYIVPIYDITRECIEIFENIRERLIDYDAMDNEDFAQAVGLASFSHYCLLRDRLKKVPYFGKRCDRIYSKINNPICRSRRVA